MSDQLKISIEHTIWCERCQHWERRSISKREVFRRQMRKEGWKLTIGKTVCPTCVKELKQKRKWDDIGDRVVPS